MVRGNSVAGCVTRYIRYIRPLYGRYIRNRSLCARTAKARLETKWQCSRDIYPAAIRRRDPCLDVQPLVERPPDNLQIDAARPVGARRPLHHLRIFELLGHRASQPTQPSHPNAKKTSPAKLSGSGCCRRPPDQPRRGARRLKAHRVGKAWLRHDKALWVARTYV